MSDLAAHPALGGTYNPNRELTFATSTGPSQSFSPPARSIGWL
jgi:hypothetical protein